MQAIIIAGGKGTRISSIAENKPKSLLEIKNKPILQYQLELLKKYNITDIQIILNYGSQKIMDFIKRKDIPGMNVSFFEEPYPLGTAGAIKLIKNRLQRDFIVLYGDIMINIDLKRLIKFHQKKRGIASIVIHPNNHPFDSDLVEIDEDNRITGFHSKPHPKNLSFNNLVNAGLYVFNKKIIKYIPVGIQSDFGKNIFPAIAESNKEAVYGYKTHEYLKDIGTIDRYSEVTKDIDSGCYQKGNRKFKKPAVFLDRDGVINKEVDNIVKLSDFKLIEKSADAIRKINRAGYLAIVISNQPQAAKGLCSISTIHEINRKMETLLGSKGAKLDAIYICLHHPEKGFQGENPAYKRSCLCRKPNTAMIKQAIRDFNIDINLSFFIGDQTRDALTAINAGITFIGVKTGYGCQDNRFKVKINRIFNNLDESVDNLSISV